ncbi:8-oxo-dGTP diphosphatase [Arthrobacter sp. APC 3897]|uniref:8-oxo-dGTP diphosphatase n=1 Tax=Arthrobacter sp. APC 3897 TaxID=3035204 RepID=UPI0025B46777|nr:8-oxo-dGTP diphosphatase [Arthrobacter sp. APC 3897]MDN3481741.1 8-oxo-dGTP diphosphatase [Arthrobacter sp. APC 3897]
MNGQMNDAGDDSGPVGTSAVQPSRAVPVVLCFLMRDTPEQGTEVLMGLKQTGFGTGRIVTLGGHVEPGETPAEAAVREVFEESGVTLRERDLERAGTIEFVFPARPEWDMSTVVYRARTWEGEPAQSPEIIPTWYRVGEVPYARMWPDSAHWMPEVLAGRYFDAVVTLGPDNESVAGIVFS